MSETLDQAEKLVGQLAQAHRLCVGFYQRILPQFDQVAIAAADAHFWYWKPSENGMPCRGSSRPSDSWAWDFVPLFASTYAYRSHDGDAVKLGSKVVVFRLYIDDAFKKDSQQRRALKGEPDPLSLATGTPLVDVCLYRCVMESDKSFGVIWNELPWAEPSDDWCSTPDISEFEFCARHVPLAEFIINTGATQSWISEKFSDKQGQ